MARPEDKNKHLAQIDKKDQLPETTTPIIPEFADVLRQQKNQVDVNILLRVAVEKAPDPQAIAAYTEQILKLSEQFEDHRLKTWQQQAQAIIDVKNRDPDEIEKRQNNRVRRGLKITIAACMVLGVGGAIGGTILGAGIVLTGMLAALGATALAMSGPLASGESVSSNDMVRILEAVKGIFNANSGGERGNKQSQKKRQ